MESFYNFGPETPSTPVQFPRSSSYCQRKTSWGTHIPPPSELSIRVSDIQEDIFDDIDLHKNSMESDNSRDEHPWDTMENVANLGLSFNENIETDNQQKFERFSLDDTANSGIQSFELKKPFNKWTKSLEWRAMRRRKTVSCDRSISTKNEDFFKSPGTQRKSAHKKSSSGSSFSFVSAVKSASISLASISAAARSKRTMVSSRQNHIDRSSKASNHAGTSEDGSVIARNIDIDQAVTRRSLQRRRVLEEMISTEENYVADVKFLTNVYVTLLASLPSICSNLRTSITRNLNEILDLHEELLGDLHEAVPHSEYIQSDGIKPSVRKHSGHQRWRSMDAVPEKPTDILWLHEIPGMIAEPKIAAEVAGVFGKKMNRLFIYEEYSAKYELMIKDVGTTHRTIPQWKDFQKGLEALALSLASINHQQDSARRAMTIGDLLVKRICKYQILFAELLKQTPVCDCPDSHMTIETVMIRLREATTEINRATADPHMKMIMEKSWLLQDRICFPNMPDAQSKNLTRSLGNIHLCGALYVSWQTQESVDGKYLICLLYRDYLLLASTAKYDQVYLVQACVGLSGMDIQEVDNGRALVTYNINMQIGLQCHTARFSWKLLFEIDHQLFEITMSACSPKEELEWRSRLASYSSREARCAAEQVLLMFISLPVKPLGTVFGKPGTIARRISVHRATTVGPMSNLCQVIIKNTSIFKEMPSSIVMNRSQSLLTTNRIPVLAPSRAERSQIESLLTDVWSRQILPYPGMTHRARSEHTVRASASSMIRKLSVASIASNFSRQSSSMTSLHKNKEDYSSKSHNISPSSSAKKVTLSKQMEFEPGQKSQLSIIPDDKENFSYTGSFDNLASASLERNINPVGLETLRSRKSWVMDSPGARTSSIRTPSINSSNLSKLLNFPIVGSKSDSITRNVAIDDLATTAEGCGLSQSTWKNCRDEKVNSRGISIVTEGIRNFFR